MYWYIQYELDNSEPTHILAHNSSLVLHAKMYCACAIPILTSELEATRCFHCRQGANGASNMSQMLKIE